MKYAHLRNDEQGFTLIELMVALLIMAILIGMALPSFMGTRDSAANTEAKSAVREAIPAVKAFIVDGGDPADLITIVKDFTPSLDLDAAAVTGVAFLVATDGSVCTMRQSTTGKVYAAWEPEVGVAEGTLYAELTAVPTTCPVYADTTAAGYSRNGW